MRHIEVLVLHLLIVSIECGRSLRDYVLLQNSSTLIRESNYLIYDENENSLLCQLQTLNGGFNSLTNLLLYPSNQRIASLVNFYSSSMSPYYMNVYDNQLNTWIRGIIYENQSGYVIKYGDQSYLMKNRLSSSIIELREQNKGNSLLSRFSLNSLNVINGMNKYNIEIFSNRLPDPIYILSFYVYDSTNSKRKLPWISFFP